MVVWRFVYLLAAGLGAALCACLESLLGSRDAWHEMKFIEGRNSHRRARARARARQRRSLRHSRRFELSAKWDICYLQ